jgi:hypothetical protein
MSIQPAQVFSAADSYDYRRRTRHSFGGTAVHVGHVFGFGTGVRLSLPIGESMIYSNLLCRVDKLSPLEGLWDCAEGVFA